MASFAAGDVRESVYLRGQGIDDGMGSRGIRYAVSATGSTYNSSRARAKLRYLAVATQYRQR